MLAFGRGVLARPDRGADPRRDQADLDAQVVVRVGAGRRWLPPSPDRSSWQREHRAAARVAIERERAVLDRHLDPDGRIQLKAPVDSIGTQPWARVLGHAQEQDGRRVLDAHLGRAKDRDAHVDVGDRERLEAHDVGTGGLAGWLIGVALASASCGGSGWGARSAFFADPARVAAALGDPPPGTARDDLELPVLPLPAHTRNCCLFGMDLRVDFAGMHVPFFELGNVIDVDELGAHAYATPAGAADVEGNGLVYTCRGGWIDTAHVREQADQVVFLALAIAHTLESGSVTRIPGHGAATTIVVAGVPPALIEREGRLDAAMALAAWAAFRISIWHELATWFGYQTVSGFSEQPSAFSPEDLYSNALGIRLGLAVLAEHDFRSDADYDLAIEAFLIEGLRRLGAIPRSDAREVMTALDGRWWDSARRVPDDLEFVLARLAVDAAAEEPARHRLLLPLTQLRPSSTRRSSLKSFLARGNISSSS